MKWKGPYDSTYMELGGGIGSGGILHVLLKIDEITTNPVYRNHIELTVMQLIARQGADGQVYDYPKAGQYADMPLKV